VQVGQQQRIAAFVPKPQRFLAVADHLRRVAEQAELLHDDLLVDLVVFGDENEPPKRACFSDAWRRHGGLVRTICGAFLELLGRRPAGCQGYALQQGLSAQGVTVQGDDAGAKGASMAAPSATDQEMARVGHAGEGVAQRRWQIVSRGVDDDRHEC